MRSLNYFRNRHRISSGIVYRADIYRTDFKSLLRIYRSSEKSMTFMSALKPSFVVLSLLRFIFLSNKFNFSFDSWADICHVTD